MQCHTRDTEVVNVDNICTEERQIKLMQQISLTSTMTNQQSKIRSRDVRKSLGQQK